MQTAVPVLPAAVLYNCGSSCWSCWLTALAKRSYHGRAMTGNSNWPIRTKWPVDGAYARTSPRWTTKSWAVAYDTTTIRTLYTKRLAKDMCINLFAILKISLGKSTYIFIHILWPRKYIYLRLYVDSIAKNWIHECSWRNILCIVHFFHTVQLYTARSDPWFCFLF